MIKRRLSRRYKFTFESRLAQAMINEISSDISTANTLKQMRERMRVIVANDALWKSYQELTKLTKRAKTLLERM